MTGRRPTRPVSGLTRRRLRRVLFQPDTQEALNAGAAQIVAAVRPTLGPLPRLTAVADVMVQNRRPELLDDGATIARRIIALPNRAHNTGAMLLRQALWAQREEVGDGTATAAVLYQAVYEAGRRYAAAGGNVMALRTGLERAMRRTHAALAQMARPLEGEAAIAQMAEALCYDRPLATLLGEIFNILGPDGFLEIRSGNRRDLSREYLDGAFWKSGWHSARMATDLAEQRAQVTDAAILVTNLEIKDVEALAPVLELAASNGAQALVVVAKSLSDSALGLLHVNNRPGAFTTLAVKPPTPNGVQPEPMWSLEDLGVLTGARVFRSEAGETLAGIRWEDLGRARRAWATGNHFGVVGGGGTPVRLRQHLAMLRASQSKLTSAEQRRMNLERLGRVLGGAALLWVGGETQSEVDFLRERAERTAAALRGALRHGVAPGGGAAYLACRPVVPEPGAAEEDKVACRILNEALEAPARTILSNAGFEPGAHLAEAFTAGPHHGFDVRSGQVVNMCEAGIVDSVAMLQAALRTSVTTAALALTTDVLTIRTDGTETD